MNTLQGRTIAFLVAPEGTEEVELKRPWEAVREAGGTPRLLSTKPGKIQAFHHLDRGDRFPVDAVVGDETVDDYDALVLPGGVANPDQLRTDQQAVGFVRAFFETRKPIAAICHGAWTLIEADVVRGRTMTSWPSLPTDLTNAGAHWVDQQLVVCEDNNGVLLTSRKPDDLDAFDDALVTHFAQR